MSTKLFVYGVNRSCPKNLLEDQFSKFGAVSDVYITEKGYAFVTMDNAGEAQAAIDELNGTQLVASNNSLNDVPFSLRWAELM